MLQSPLGYDQDGLSATLLFKSRLGSEDARKELLHHFRPGVLYKPRLKLILLLYVVLWVRLMLTNKKGLLLICKDLLRILGCELCRVLPDVVPGGAPRV